MTMLKIALFGEFALEDEAGNLIKIRSRKAKLLLAFLLLKKERNHQREKLVDMFWPDNSEKQGKQNLRQALYTLRKTLEPFEESGSRYILADPLSIQLNHEQSIWSDALQFDELLGMSESVSDEERFEILKQAVSLYNDDLLSDCYDDWCLEEREYFRNRLLAALSDLTLNYSEQRDYDQAIETAKLSLKHDPFQEQIHYQLMMLHAAIGDRSSAIQQYQDCEQILREELGVEPLPETKALFQELQSRSASMLIQDISDRTELGASFIPELGSPFVNRKRELKQLVQAMHTVMKGNGKTLVVSGEPGVGKSRIVEEFLTYAHHQGFLVLKGVCNDVEGKLPFHALKEALKDTLYLLNVSETATLTQRSLKEVVKLLPELREIFVDLEPSPPLSSHDQERTRLFDGLLQLIRSLSKIQPLALALDDLQWADLSLLQFIHFLARHIEEDRILLIGAYREGEVTETHPLREILDRLIRDQQLEAIPLAPLSAAEVEELVCELLGTAELETYAQVLFKESNGVPFYVEELIKASIEEGSLIFEEGTGWQLDESSLISQAVPNSIRALVGTRLRRLKPGAKGMLELAAVLGNSFSKSLLLSTKSGQKQSLKKSLVELLERNFLTEGDGQLEFPHDVIRHVVYDGIAEDKVRLLHLQVGESVEQIYDESNPDDKLTAELATHYCRGDKWAKALKYSLAAGQLAWQRHYAKDEAIGFLEQALELADNLDDEHRITLCYKTLGDICAKTDEQDHGMEYCQKALELCEDPEGRAEIYGSIASVYHNKHEMEKGLESCERGLDELGSEGSGRLRASLLYQAATFLNWVKEPEKAEEYCEQALKLFRALKDSVLQTRCLSLLGQILAGLEKFDLAIEYLKKATHEAEELDDPLTIGIAYFQLGVAQFNSGDFEESIESLNQSLEEMSRLSAQHMAIGSILNFLVLAQIATGDLDSALSSANEQIEQAIFAGNQKKLSLSYGMLGCLQDHQGDLELANQSFEKALEIFPQNDIFYAGVILTYLHLGDVEKAVEWLNQGNLYLRQRDLDRFKNGPEESTAFLSFRGHPAFAAIVKSLE